MRLKDMIEEACATHDIHTILGTRKRSIVCPLPQHIHKNHTASFSIFWKEGRQYWKCHGNCQLEGDVVDLVGYLRVPGYTRWNPQSVRRALTSIDERYEIEYVKPKKETILRGGEWNDFLPPGEEVIEYAKTRGLTAETLRIFRVGQCGQNMSMPCFMDKKLKGIKMRRLGSTGLRYWSLEGSRQGLFNFDNVAYKQEPVLMVKAEIPCMLMHQEGFLACAPTGGESSGSGWNETWRTALALARVIVVGDNDEPGRKLGLNRAVIMNGKLVFPPVVHKDIDEWWLSDPEGARKQITKWMEEA
ncbi:MAG: hypothetical protein ABSE06_01230 [Anaerolineaceae bacterium]|jgi:hypothetical protein